MLEDYHGNYGSLSSTKKTMGAYHRSATTCPLVNGWHLFDVISGQFIPCTYFFFMSSLLPLYYHNIIAFFLSPSSKSLALISEGGACKNFKGKLKGKLYLRDKNFLEHFMLVQNIFHCIYVQNILKVYRFSTNRQLFIDDINFPTSMPAWVSCVHRMLTWRLR